LGGEEEPRWSFRKDWREAVEVAVPKDWGSWGCEVGFRTIGGKRDGIGLSQLWVGS